MCPVDPLDENEAATVELARVDETRRLVAVEQPQDSCLAFEAGDDRSRRGGREELECKRRPVRIT